MSCCEYHQQSYQGYQQRYAKTRHDPEILQIYYDIVYSRFSNLTSSVIRLYKRLRMERLLNSYLKDDLVKFPLQLTQIGYIYNSKLDRYYFKNKEIQLHSALNRELGLIISDVMLVYKENCLKLNYLRFSSGQAQGENSIS